MTRIPFLLLATCLLAAGNARADTCKAQADAKNLHGAAQTSFMNKCEKDAKSKCTADAKAKNLHGAAQTSFVTKCEQDLTGI